MFIDLDWAGDPISLNTDHIVAVKQWFRPKDTEMKYPLAEIHLDSPIKELDEENFLHEHSRICSYQSYKDVVVFLENAKMS